jgi:hypothetical protein
MALEKRDATRLITFDPPLPRRGFAITSSSSSTVADTWGGGSGDGRLYGKFTIDASQWSGVNGSGVPPLSPGEKFQVWTWRTDQPNHGFYPSTGIPQYSSAGSPDLYKIDAMTVIGNVINPDGSGKTPWALKTPDVRTVLGITQKTTNAWDVYFTPYLSDDIDFTNDGIVTLPEPMHGVWLGVLGHETSLTYSWSCPGGPTNLSFSLQVPPDKRVPALNPGRVLQAFRGASCIWEGTLGESQPTSTGWDVTASGAGTYGQDYAALYDTWNADNPVNKAIGRGLRWHNDGVGKPDGIYLATPQDSGSLLVQDFLNQLTAGGSLYWSVEPPAGASVPARPWSIRLRPFPSDINGDPLSAGVKAPEQWVVQEWQRLDLKAALRRLPPDLYLVNVNPVPRTIENDYNTLVIKYQVHGDITATSTKAAKAAVFAEIIVDNPASVAPHNRNEYYLDISSAGTMTEAQVVAVGKNVLNHYVRANFAGAYTIQPGQLLNNGGVAVDLGCNYAGKTVTVQVNNQAFGGEVGFTPLTFLIGEYSFDDETQTATATPYQNQKNDIQSVLALLYPGKFT